MEVMEQQTEALDLHTNALQILLGKTRVLVVLSGLMVRLILVSCCPLVETLLQCTDLASCVRLLKPEHVTTGLELIRRIRDRLLAILQHSTQVS